MSSRLAVVVLVASLAMSLSGQSLTYYIDGLGGSDAADGRTAATAWRSIGKVSLRTFQPGDSILLRAGSTWTGQMILEGSGSSTAPIVVDRYGTGPKPRIDGNGLIGSATVHLRNGSFWEIGNLEITNTNDPATAGDRRGLLVSATDAGLIEHIVLRGLSIHDVKGIVGQDDAAKRTAGIGIETVSDAVVPTRFNDILIEGCTIFNIENTGIYTDNLVFRNTPGTADWTRRRFTNVVIRNNVIHHISKNAMILRMLDGGLVEHNVCYETAIKVTGNTMFTTCCDGTVFQFNEGYLNRATESEPGGGDGSMYDADLKSRNVIFQYSYSHDNSHGLFWNATVQADSGIIVRYNISRNDKGNIFTISYPVTSIYIYNNTVVIGSGVSPAIISERNIGTGTRWYQFANNIIYNLSPTSTYDLRTVNYTRVIDYNLYYGFHPAGEPSDANKLTSDPKFVDAASGGTGIASVVGLQLQQASPAVNSGQLQPTQPAFDLWGGAVPNGSVDRGAHEFWPASGAIDAEETTPRTVGLQPAFPNPFNPDTNLRFSLSERENVEVAIYDMRGRLVRTVWSGEAEAGEHTVTWSGTDGSGRPAASGVYLGRLTTARTSSVVRMIMIR